MDYTGIWGTKVKCHGRMYALRAGPGEQGMRRSLLGRDKSAQV